MKICFISNPNSPHTIRWVNWFAKRSHQTLLIGDNSLKSEWVGSPIISLPSYNNSRVIKYVVWEFVLRRVIKQWQPDLLHAHRISSAGWLGAFSGFHPYLVTPWGSDILLQPEHSPIARWLAVYTIKRADKLLCNSDHIYKTLIRYGSNPRKTEMIPWGVDLLIFHPGSPGLTKEELGITNEYVVLCPRAVNPIYNQDVIIEAISAVISRISDILFILQKYNEDIEYYKELERRIKELHIENFVKWIPFQTSDRLADYFRMSDIVISVPSSDSRPVSIMEAMACGVPVIASNLPAVGEIIKDEENGLLVPVKDAKSLAKAILALLKNSHLREVISKNNSTFACENADLDVQMGKVEMVYQSMVIQ